MSLVCALSNEVPEHPVISPVSGYVFEKRLITKFINENGTDPMSSLPNQQQEALTVDQLIDIKANPLVKPKPPSATSIPALLKSMQDEWDSVMLHSFTLRQQLQTARQELSHSLYQQDAACRVIARLTKEVSAAREALATLKPHTNTSNNNNVPQTINAGENNSIENGTNGNGAPQEVEMKTAVLGGINEQVAKRLVQKSAELTQLRKSKVKKLPESLATCDDLRQYKCVNSHTGLHSASSAVTGITCLDLKPSDSSKCVTGGNDKTAVVFNNSSEQIEATLKGHTKRVTQCIFHPESSDTDPTSEKIITASADSTIRIWAGEKQTQILKCHVASVTGISLHSLGNYLLSCSADRHWAFSDIQTGQTLLKVSSEEQEQEAPELTCAKLHPDGLIFGTGTADSVIKIWDLKTKNNLANFPGHTGPISCLAFSENGYYLATSARNDSCIKLWDLRKLKNFRTIELNSNSNNNDGKFEIKDLSFDMTGSYLACAGTGVRVYHSKQWDLVKTFDDHTAMATGVRFGINAKTIVSCSLDKSLKFYSL